MDGLQMLFYQAYIVDGWIRYTANNELLLSCFSYRELSLAIIYVVPCIIYLWISHLIHIRFFIRCDILVDW